MGNLCDLAGKKVSVLGAGRTGIAVSRFLHAQGAAVFLSEKAKHSSLMLSIPRYIDAEYGEHSRRVLDADLIIKSPGISHTIPVLKKARLLRIPVWDELELVARYIPKQKVVAITGTNGKTTTTSLVAALFKQAGLNTVTAGNIGIPLSGLMNKISRADVIVLELSSYQLEQQRSFASHIAAVLNLAPDHLQRHKSMINYRNAKERIFLNQNRRDFCVLNYEDPSCRIMARSCQGKVVFFSSRRKLSRGIYNDHKGWHFNACTINPRWRLPGTHNIENGLAAMGIAMLFGISPKNIEKGMSLFNGVRHRLEPIARINGAQYINDSKATNVSSTTVALQAVRGPLWLILGGRDKGSSYKPLIPLLKGRTAGVLLIGEAANKIKKELKGAVPMVNSKTMKKAVMYCVKHAGKGEQVLLSPACASFDQYADFEERGDDFCQLVHAMKEIKNLK